MGFMFIIVLSLVIGGLAIFTVVYAIYAFLQAMTVENNKAQARSSILEKENEQLRFEKKHIQLRLNQLESNEANQ